MSGYPVVGLSTDALLTTTRSVRRRLDLTKPVPIGLILKSLEIPVQAPTFPPRQTASARERRAFRPVLSGPMTSARKGSCAPLLPLAERPRR